MGNINYSRTSKKSIYHKYIEISKQNQKREQYDCEFDDAINKPENKIIVFSIELKQTLKTLTDKQQKVIKLLFFYGYSESEVANILHISKQAVNRLKNSALKI